MGSQRVRHSLATKQQQQSGCRVASPQRQSACGVIAHRDFDLHFLEEQ